MTEVSASPAPAPESTYQPPVSPPPSTNSNRTTLWIVIAVVVLLIVIGLAYWAYNQWGSAAPGASVATYDECVLAGGELTTGVQPTCQLANGQSFVAPETPTGTAPNTQAPAPVAPTLLQECPEKLVIEMIEITPLPIPEGGDLAQARSYRQSNQYYVYSGERVDSTQVNLDWVGQNCQVTIETNLE